MTRTCLSAVAFMLLVAPASAYGLMHQRYKLICPQDDLHALVLQDAPTVGILKALSTSCAATHGGASLGEWCQLDGDIYVQIQGRTLRYLYTASDAVDGCGLDPVCFCSEANAL